MTTIESGFPRTLLAAKDGARLHYFQRLWLLHPHFAEAHQRLRRLLRLSEPGRLIVLNGPTGAGKTRVCQMVLADLLEAEQSRMQVERDYVPGFICELAADADGRFDWRDHYRRSLALLNEPLIDSKVVVNELTRALEWGTERVLRQAYEHCLRYRKVRLAIWDEAHHLRKVAGGRAFVEQMDAVKSLVNLTGTMHLLAGTYELLDLCDLSAELARRAYDVHLPRYGDSSAERRMFANTVRSLQVHLPVAEQADLSSLGDYLHERSLGCVGILKDWLVEALALALEEKAPTVNEKHLQHTGYPAGKLRAIREEIEHGEWRRREIDGLPEPPAQSLPARRVATFARRPGQRLPVRDPVPAAPPS